MFDFEAFKKGGQTEANNLELLRIRKRYHEYGLEEEICRI